jgi:arylsulfatase A-like enzyme
MVSILAAALLGCGVIPGLETSTPTQPNVVVFMLDAARADHIGCYGYARPTTPHIDAFARTATRYTRAVSEGSFTFASTSALFTGMPPDRTGLLKARRIDNALVLFAEIARTSGYRTHAYSENPYVTASFGFNRGFQEFEAALGYREFRDKLRHFEHSEASVGIDGTLRFMDEEPGVPFLAYLHLLRPHNPYTPPDGFAGRFGSRPKSPDGATHRLLAIDARGRRLSPRRLENIVALYDESLAYADAMFGRLLDGMRERGLLDDTIVIVVSDHGEAFREHGRLLHGSTAYDEMIRIPLLVWVPGGTARVVDRPIQLADLGTALREVVAGSEAPFERVTELGRGADDPMLSWTMRYHHRACVRTASQKLIVDTDSLEALAYYDLESDPKELTALPLDQEAQRLLECFRTRVREGHVSLTKPADFEIEPELVEQLEALGYTNH